jgi:uncharacterized protein (DUF433 family)
MVLDGVGGALMMEIIADPVLMTVDQDGMVRIAGTRITLDTIVGAYKRGDTPEEIVDGFPSLSLADIHAVIAYYLRHHEIVDAYIAENHRQARVALQEYEAKFGPMPTRADLERRVRERG